jgi:DNA-binding NarL/FixJ family response regulator
MRVLIVDDHEVVREGLRSALAADSKIEIVGSVGTGAKAVELTTLLHPDVAIVDLRLPDMSGDEACRLMRAAVPSMAVVMLSTYLSEEAVRSALRAGATAYLTKAAGIAELRAMLNTIDADEHLAPLPHNAPQIVERLHTLVEGRNAAAYPTPRQQRVLQLAAEGLTNLSIGQRLYISESTVRFHIQRLKQTLGARTKTELVAKAIRMGAIDAPEAQEVVLSR